MAHPQEDNQTPFAFTAIYGPDEAFKQAAVAMLKASFRIRPEHEGPLIPLGEQIPFCPEGQYWGEPDTSCYLLEPEVAPIKLTTDIVLVGTARAPEPGLRYFDAGLRVGSVVQGARVFGDRFWYRSGTGKAISAPEVVEQVPLTWHYAFGGKDLSVLRDEHHPAEARNPFGMGYHHPAGKFVDGGPLPNIENPRQLISHYQDHPEPIGFGFAHPHVQTRAQYAGTYDKRWDEERKPLLPTDFNPRFFQAAPVALQAPSYLQGNEEVSVLNAAAWPKLRFRLPGLALPQVKLEERNGRLSEATLMLDTLVINTDDNWVSLLYRAKIPIQRSAHSVAKISVSMAGIGKQTIFPLPA